MNQKTAQSLSALVVPLNARRILTTQTRSSCEKCLSPSSSKVPNLLGASCTEQLTKHNLAIKTKISTKGCINVAQREASMPTTATFPKPKAAKSFQPWRPQCVTSFVVSAAPDQGITPRPPNAHGTHDKKFRFEFAFPPTKKTIGPARCLQEPRRQSNKIRRTRARQTGESETKNNDAKTSEGPAARRQLYKTPGTGPRRGTPAPQDTCSSGHVWSALKRGSLERVHELTVCMNTLSSQWV